MDIYRHRAIGTNKAPGERPVADAPAKPAGADALGKFFRCRQARTLPQRPWGATHALDTIDLLVDSPDCVSSICSALDPAADPARHRRATRWLIFERIEPWCRKKKIGAGRRAARTSALCGSRS